MPNLYDLLPGFHDEVTKIAGIADFVTKNKGMLGSAGALLGHGAAAGAVLGGLHEGYKGYEDARAQGASGLGAGLGALGGAVGGASSGALGGALIGGGAGAALHTLRPQAADAARKALSAPGSRLGALGRFGQRQMHGLTGWTPPEGLSSDAIRGGSWATGKALASAPKDAKNYGKLVETHALQKEVESKGLTNLPGVVGALAGSGRGDAAKLLAKHTWKNADPMMKAQLALAPVGAVAAMAGPEEAGGPGKGERVGSSIGNTVGSLASSALPFGAGQLAMGAGRAAGGKAGKMVDWLRGKSSTDAANLATNEGQHIPTERHVGGGMT